MTLPPPLLLCQLAAPKFSLLCGDTPIPHYPPRHSTYSGRFPDARLLLFLKVLKLQGVNLFPGHFPQVGSEDQGAAGTSRVAGEKGNMVTV